MEDVLFYLVSSICLMNLFFFPFHQGACITDKRLNMNRGKSKWILERKKKMTIMN